MEGGLRSEDMGGEARAEGRRPGARGHLVDGGLSRATGVGSRSGRPASTS